MSQILGPDFIALQVRDLEAAKRFYTEKLGLVPVDRSPPGAVLFKTTPIPFALRTPLVDLSATKLLGWGVSLWLKCENADALHGKLEAGGVEIVAGLQDGPFGRFFSFRDLDGYTITLHS